jgi:hypothetical protein
MLQLRIVREKNTMDGLVQYDRALSMVLMMMIML